MKVKTESEKVGLKLNIQKTKVVTSSPNTSWQTDEETVERLRDIIFSGSKITADGDCRHEIKRCWFLGRKAMTNLVQFSSSVMSDIFQPHGLQHLRPPCPSPTPGVHSDSCPSSQWCLPVISSSVVPFSSCPQSLPASECFPMSQLFTWGERLLISWLQSPSAVILDPPKIKSVTVSTVSPSICHEVMGPDAMILVFWMLSFKPTFPLSSLTFIKRLFSFSSLSALRVVSYVP